MKYKEFRINIIDVEAREEFGDWKSIAKWEGKSIIADKSLKGILRKLKFWFEKVVKPVE